MSDDKRWPTIEELARVQPMSADIRERMFELFIKPNMPTEENDDERSQ